MPLQQGEMIDAYRIIAPLGQGGTGRVYRANDVRMNRDVAIKLIRPTYFVTPDFLSNFEREAKTIAALEHPHIVRVYDVGEHADKPYIVLELIDGETLKTRMTRVPLLPDEIAALFQPIAAALDYAHQRGVLHRDIKPSNILLDADAIPYITDFAFPCIAINGIGTPQYAAPEQASGNNDTDYRADLYSLGVVLYELFTGEVPFSGAPRSILSAQLHQSPPLPSSLNPAVNPEVEAVLLRALAKAPGDRYQSARELISALCSAIQQDRNAADESDTQPLEIPQQSQAPSSTETTIPAEPPVSKAAPRRYWMWAAWLFGCAAAGAAAAVVVSVALAAPNP